MLWIVFVVAAACLLAFSFARTRRHVPRDQRSLSHYHDGLDALSRIEEKRSL